MHKYNTNITRAFLQGVCISMLSIVLQHADLRTIIVGFGALGLAYVLGRMDHASEYPSRHMHTHAPRGSYPRGE